MCIPCIYKYIHTYIHITYIYTYIPLHYITLYYITLHYIPYYTIQNIPYITYQPLHTCMCIYIYILYYIILYTYITAWPTTAWSGDILQLSGSSNRSHTLVLKTCCRLGAPSRPALRLWLCRAMVVKTVKRKKSALRNKTANGPTDLQRCNKMQQTALLWVLMSS